MVFAALPEQPLSVGTSAVAHGGPPLRRSVPPAQAFDGELTHTRAETIFGAGCAAAASDTRDKALQAQPMVRIGRLSPKLKESVEFDRLGQQ
jgi:hypothetical protein